MNSEYYIRKFEIPGLPPLEMSFVKGGLANIGSELDDVFGEISPTYVVSVPDFWMARFPVSQKLYAAVMNEYPSSFVGDGRPVEQVGYFDAIQFLKKLNEIYCHENRLTLLDYFQLPAEHQWEYAANGGVFRNQMIVEKFSGSSYLDEVGWFIDSAYETTQVSGLKRPNVLGIYDMSGNVWEWCADKWEKHEFKVKRFAQNSSPLKPETAGGGEKVSRGGSFGTGAWACRNAYRRKFDSNWRDDNRGFRFVFVPSPANIVRN